MRVLFLSNFYPPYEIGGYEQWCEEVANLLMVKGHKIHILTSRYGTSGNNSQEPHVTRTLYLQTDINHYNISDTFFSRLYKELYNLRELKRNLIETSPDAVFIWGMWNLSHYVPFFIEKQFPTMTAYYISSYWPSDVDPHRAYWKIPARHPILNYLKKIVNKLVLAQLKIENYPPKLSFPHVKCCSKYVRDRLVMQGAIPKKAGVLYGGINIKDFSCKNNNFLPNRECLKLIYVGRLIEDKGVQTAIEALQFVKEKGFLELIELTIIGNGHPSYENFLLKLSEELKVSNRINFMGWISKNEITSILQQHDVFLFTSIWPEPMARSVMEAMAAGLLVIGTEVGGQVEMLHNGDNSLTYMAGDSVGLGTQIIKVLNNPSLLESLRENGRKMVLDKFSLDRMVDDIEKYLFNVLKA
jgi:glycogen synthase